MPEPSPALVLVGHGGVPRDYPRKRLSRLRRLEARREASGEPVSEEEALLDQDIRRWPRSARTDPYREGLERLGESLRTEMPTTPVVLAYNEFCAPSLEEAAACLIGAGFRRITFLSAMMTPGGSHSERDIPEAIEALRRRHPGIDLA